jgi:hypothetical protein
VRLSVFFFRSLEWGETECIFFFVSWSGVRLGVFFFRFLEWGETECIFFSFLGVV